MAHQHDWDLFGDRFNLYRRHEGACTLRPLGARSDINACNCPLWMYGSVNGERVRKSLNTRSVSVGTERMRNSARAQWVLAGEEGPADPVVVLEAARAIEQRLRKVERSQRMTRLLESGWAPPANPLGTEHAAPEASTQAAAPVEQSAPTPMEPANAITTEAAAVRDGGDPPRPQTKRGRTISEVAQRILARWNEMGRPRRLAAPVADELAQTFLPIEFSKAPPYSKRRRKLRDRIGAIIRWHSPRGISS